MKIEKISDVQVKIVLEENDLIEHDIRLTELTNGSEKLHALFQEMMEQALIQCGFEVKNTPLLIEAIPMPVNSIIIIVTKVLNSENIEESFSFPPRSRVAERFKTKDILEVAVPAEKEQGNSSKTTIFSFGGIDEIMDASGRIYKFFNGMSAVFKYQSRYYLVLENYSLKSNSENLDSILAEYGRKHVSNKLSKFYLSDHGESIIEKDAIEILANIV